MSVTIISYRQYCSSSGSTIYKSPLQVRERVVSIKCSNSSEYMSYSSTLLILEYLTMTQLDNQFC